MKENNTLERIKAIKIEKHILDLDVPVIPLRDKIIIQKITSQQVTAAGLLLVEGNKSNRPMGRIIAYGPQCSEYIKKGLVVVHDNMFTPLVLNGIDYVMINEAFVDCIVADEKQVHVPVDPLTGDDIRKAEKRSNVDRVRKMNAVKYDNTMDEFHEKAKDRQKNPTISKYKRK